MMKKNKIKVSESKKEKSTKIWYAIIVIVFIIIVVLNEIPMIIYMLGNKSDEDKDVIKSIAEGSVISTGLDVIGLAIAVWTGLNIINAVSRQEVNKMKEDLNDIINSKEELSDIINKMENKSKNEFLIELLKTDKDEMSRYYYKKFKEEDVSFSKLIEIEHIFNKIYEMHTNGNVSSEQIIRETEELEIKIKEISESIDDICEIGKLRFIENYLNFRKAEGLFYKGYELRDEEKKYDTYAEAVLIYLDVASKLDIKFPKYEAKLIFDDNFWENDVNKYYNNSEITAYFANTIGEAYGNMALARPKSKEFEIKSIASKAVFYGRFAVDCAEKHNINKEVYYKNLGCNYERLERIENNNSFFNSKNALDNYRKAFELTINKPQLSSKQMSRVYHTYLSYINKYIKNKLKIDFTEKKTNFFKKTNSLKDISDIIININEMNKVASIAIIDDIRKTSNIAMYGFVNGYISVLKQMKNNEEINEMFIKNSGYYLEKMKWSIDTLDIMNIKDTYCEELKSFYIQLKIILSEKE